MRRVVRVLALIKVVGLRSNALLLVKSPDSSLFLLEPVLLGGCELEVPVL